MNVNNISRWIRIVIGTFLTIASITGCVLAFREGDKQTGYLLVVGSVLAIIYLYSVLSGKSGFGKI
ncbi:MAG: hypothetical protein IPN31_12505 [Bacteroidetes bacterium]|nr:hypothetical protein [Bacteroidota bacterium]